MRLYWLKLQRFWKRTLPQSLLARSLLILILPFVLTMVIGTFVFFDRHWSTMTFRLADSLAGEVAFVADSWDQNPDSAARAKLIQQSANKFGFSIHYSDQQKQIPRNKTLRVPGISQPLLTSLYNKVNRPLAVRPTQNRWIVINVQVQDGVLQFSLPQKRLFSTTTYVFLLIMIGSGLLLSLIAIIFMRNQIRPVRKLALVAEQFGKGLDAPRFKPTGAREVRQAARAFLEMRDRIKRQIRQRTDMLSGVSHDLRTPLTRLKLQLAMLPPGPDITAMQGDIAAMEKMINAYLDFARDETLEYSLRCNIIDLLQQAVSDARKQKQTIDVEWPESPIILTVRPQAIQRVFTNILDNMRLYGGKGWVTINKLSRSVEIIFDDDGPGIPEDKREDVFKPFHRLDASRNQNIEGTGLGLTIARDIVQSHGGTILLADSPHSGLRVTLRIPL